jgi:hypothetical protein
MTLFVGFFLRESIAAPVMISHARNDDLCHEQLMKDGKPQS